MSETNSKLWLWQDRLTESERYWNPEIAKMDLREKLYRGADLRRPLTDSDEKSACCDRDGTGSTHLVRNICFEMIETQISSDLEWPVVTPIHPEDEGRAKKIEHWLRNELERQNSYELNDLAERIIPSQGGVIWHNEWDENVRTHSTIGADVRTLVHPRNLRPQPNVYDIDDMDWVIIEVPTTKEAVQLKYGISVEDETDPNPESQGPDTAEPTQDQVSIYIGYARDAQGWIDKYVWCNQTELEDLDNYQARRLPYCTRCHRQRPAKGQILQHVQDLPDAANQQAQEAAAAGQLLADQMAAAGETTLPQGQAMEPEVYDGGPCPYCGNEEFSDEEAEFEEIVLDIDTGRTRTVGQQMVQMPDGSVAARDMEQPIIIPGNHPGITEDGRAAMVPTLIPYYRPNLYPVILQRNVSVPAQLLGNSDIDVLASHQAAINRLEQKILDQLIDHGSVITVPDTRVDIKLDSKDGKVIPVKNLAEKQLIDTVELCGDIQPELSMLNQYYEEARQMIGITDSFQGRRDPTATSGAAKEFAAGRAAGRMESKRTMKKAAYSRMFELMFKFRLAYGDEPTPVSYLDSRGDRQYETFSRYEFLDQDPDGSWYYADEFIFGCDDTGGLAANREAMWQETRMNLQSGAYGNPADPATLILFWSIMAGLHYPGAETAKTYLEERQEQLQAQQQAQIQAQQQAVLQNPMGPGGPGAMM